MAKGDKGDIGWAIAGTGWFASNYIAPAVGKALDTRLVAVYSRDKEKGDAFAARYGAERSYDSFDALLSDSEIDVVHLTTPNSLHAEQCIKAAEAGKHVMCEKPMALSVDDCERMIESCHENNVKLGMGFQNRHHPAHVEARRLIESDMVGEITMATAQYSRWLGYSFSGWRADAKMAGGGALMGLGVHCLDLLRFLLKRDVEEVTALTDEKWTGLSVDETVVIILKFENGPFCQVISGIHVPRAYNDVVIYGTKARITGVNTVGMPLHGELEVIGDGFTSEMVFASSDIGNYILQTEAFNRCILENREPNASGVDGLEMTRLTDTILESARQGRAVKIARK